MIRVHHVAASDILHVRVEPHGHAGVPFLNWRVAPRAVEERAGSGGDYVGAGLYGVCIDGALAYVGSFLGSTPGVGRGRKLAGLAGDIVRARWWQHVGSITGRAHKLHVAPGTVLALESEFGGIHPMVQGLRAASPLLHRDAGCLGALGRLRWAATHFAGIRQADPARVLDRFSFVYARTAIMPAGASASSLAQAIRAAEKQVVGSHNLLINDAGADSVRAVSRLSVADASMLLRDELLHAIDRHA